MLADIVALCLAVFALLGSPGPGPLALAGVGAAFGPRKGANFLFGILVAIAVVMVLTGFGASALLSASPKLRVAVQLLALGYIIYVAWRVAGVAAFAGGAEKTAPSFTDGFLLNILNPKAYAAFTAIFAAFPIAHTQPLVSAGLTATISFVLVVIIDTAWLMAGAGLRPIAADPVRGRPLRILFATMMVAAAVYGLTRL